jgi:hypothetical protein
MEKLTRPAVDLLTGPGGFVPRDAGLAGKSVEQGL